MSQDTTLVKPGEKSPLVNAVNERLEAKGGVVQATKHDQDKPQIFLIPARGWQALTAAKFSMMPNELARLPTDPEAELKFIKFFTQFKTGTGYTALAVAGVIIMQLLGDPSRTDSWLIAKHKVTKVFEYGAKKYKVGNWHAGEGFAWSRLIRAAEGHADSYFSGEVIDPESGLDHLAHCMCCILMLLEHHLTGFGTDDRAEYQHIPPTPPLTDTTQTCGHDNGHKATD